MTGAAGATGRAASTARSFAFENGELKGSDFLRLMIEELLNQDPLEPMKNEELLAQVSAIKNMETLTKLGDTLEKVTTHQQLASAGALIGKRVEGVSDSSGNVAGIVAKVSVSGDGEVSLVTEAGQSVPFSKVTSIEEADQNG